MHSSLCTRLRRRADTSFTTGASGNRTGCHIQSRRPFAILGAMSALRRNSRPWFLILVVAVLVTRLGGVHLHLCFDGQEPPATIHVNDSDAHDDAHHVDEHHTDQDVEMFEAVLAKSKGSVDLPLLLGACLLLLLLHPAGGHWPRDAFYRVFQPPPHALRPPLRGPPLKYLPT